MWLIINSKICRYVLKSHATSVETVLHLTPEQEKDKSHFTDKEVVFMFFFVPIYIYFFKFFN